MKRTFPGVLALLLATASLALAQAQAPDRPAEQGSSTAVGIIMLLPLLALGLLIYSIFWRSRKYPAAMDRSLQIAEETLQLQRQAVTLQAETNRLLGRLIEERGVGAR